MASGQSLDPFRASIFLVLTFLSLWALERGTAEGPETGDRISPGAWLVLAGAGGILAFFTRSAGLPLVLAIAVALLVARRIGAATAFGVVLALPGVWWLFRLRGGGEGAYQSEFWMVNPYEPELGTITLAALPSRAWSNLRLYVETVLPGEWWPGTPGWILASLGVLLAGLAVWGWFERARLRLTAAEIFVALYLGLILVWPEVWSGDRFLLPLYPFILLYAGESVSRVARPMGRTLNLLVVSGGFLVLLLPALPTWLSLAGEANACRRIAEAGDPVRCQGSGFQEFRDASGWAGVNLPPEAIVLNRKPRIHYLFGGPRGWTYPFTRDPELFLVEADRVGARYLLLDHVDTISLSYLPAVLQARPLAFCHIIGWGGGSNLPGTDLFGILPPDQRRSDGDVGQLQRCPNEYRRGPEVQPVVYGPRIPRVAGGLRFHQSGPSP